MFAAQEGQTPIIDLLLRAGADINGTSEHSSTAISLAALAGHTRVVELLLDRGALVSDHAAGMPLLGLFAITAPSISESLIFYRRERLLRITHEV